MTTASDYLGEFVAQARDHAPSITMSTIQRNELPPGTRNWKPGIGSYGWGINGRVVNDQAGAPTALRFGVRSWFSDRRTNPAASPPGWQQFSAADSDEQRLTLAPAGTNVSVEIVLLRWGNAIISATSFLFEPSSRQLLFVVPGAGPGAPSAILTISMHPTGNFGFL